MTILKKKKFIVTQLLTQPEVLRTNLGKRTAQGSGGIAKIILKMKSKHLKVIFNHINLVLSRQAASKGNCYLQWRQHK